MNEELDKTLNRQKTNQAKTKLELCIGGYSDAGSKSVNQDSFSSKVPHSLTELKYKERLLNSNRSF